MDLNKVMLIGRVVKDPEVKTLSSGQMVASLTVVTNKKWTDKSGLKQEKAEFHNVIAWRKLAEILQQYVGKGMKIYIEGGLETRTWDDPQGAKKYRTEIVASNLIMLEGKSKEQPKEHSTQEPQEASAYPAENEISIDDIPF